MGCQSYLGIDPSKWMVDIITARWPQDAYRVRVMQTRLDAFVGAPGEVFDAILALDGVGSYLTDNELARIPLLLAPGGRAVVMFYRDVKPGVRARAYRPGLFAGEVRELGSQVACVYHAVE